MPVLSQFLIVFDHEQGAMHQDVDIFVDSAEALRVYDAAERHFAEQEHIEVVLIGVDRSTHRPERPLPARARTSRVPARSS